MTAEAAAGTIGVEGAEWLRAALEPGLAARLRPELTRLDWAAALPNPAAPAYVFLAGAVGGVPVGGGGAGLAEAAARLTGEAAEVIAQHADLPATGTPGDPAIDALWTDEGARVAAADLATGAALGVPAAAIVPALAAQRRADAPPCSLGLAAGPDRDAARLAGLLELVERDAASHWWLDSRQPRAVDPALAQAAGLAELRAGAGTPRATTLLALASAAGVPVICAMSRDPAGAGLAFGLKAALRPEAAVRGAVIELLQMEIALQMAAHRASRGAATPGDAAALTRAALDAEALPAFSARPAAALPRPPADLRDLVGRLVAAGCRVVAADLPATDGGLAVAKAFATGLRPLPGGPHRPRAGSPGGHAALM